MAENQNIDLMSAHFAALLGLSEMRIADAGHRTARHADSAHHGVKVVEAVAAHELLISNDPSQMAGLNAGVRIPTTLDHPGIKGS